MANDIKVIVSDDGTKMKFIGEKSICSIPNPLHQHGYIKNYLMKNSQLTLRFKKSEIEEFGCYFGGLFLGTSVVVNVSEAKHVKDDIYEIKINNNIYVQNKHPLIDFKICNDKKLENDGIIEWEIYCENILPDIDTTSPEFFTSDFYKSYEPTSYPLTLLISGLFGF